MKKLLIILTLFLFSYASIAQNLEVGLSLGISNYLGDLAPSGFRASLGESHLSTGAFVKYNMNPWTTLRVNLAYGKISASDQNADTQNRQDRNLSFRSGIYELALMGEVNILGFEPYALQRAFSPYVFGGIALYQFNPQANFDGVWYDLQPLGTEGQGMPGGGTKYERLQVSIPFGGGIKYALNQSITISGEIGFRKTFTDYLDDVSLIYPDLALLEEINGSLAAELSWRGEEINPEATPPLAGSGRGDPSDLDWYIFSGISISYNFYNFSLNRKNSRVTKIKCYSF